MSFINNQNWRYATKKFDATKIVAPEKIEELKEAISLTASSYGLQPYQILVIENPKLKQELQPASWGQSQIVDASHLLIFANKTDVSDEYIDAYIANTAQTRKIPVENLEGYSSFMKSTVNKMTPEAIETWTSKQAYIALGNLLNAAAELKIDTTPIEGFDSEKYNEILGLKEKGLNATVVAAVGYRSDEDATQHLKKIRKPKNELFIKL